METEEKIVKEKVYESGKKEYASKAVGGTALGIAIGALALNLWNRGGFGGNSAPENVNINAVGGMGGFGAPSVFQTWQKETGDVLALTNEMWSMRLGSERQIDNVRAKDAEEKFGLYKIMMEGDFGLYKNQAEMGFNLYKSQRDLYDTLNDRYSDRFNHLDKKVAVMEATRPYQDRLIQSEIREALNAAITYTDRKTCRCLYGVVGLPNNPVTVLEGATPFGCIGQPSQAQAKPQA